MITRKATINDLEMIEYFVIEAINEIDRYAKMGVNTEKVLNTVRSFIKDDKCGVVLLAEVNGIPVGGFVGGLSDEWQSDNHTAFDMVNYVSPEFRSLGVARELANRFISWAKSKGAYSVMCGTSTDVNTEHAVNLYGSMGFKKIGVFMELEL